MKRILIRATNWVGDAVMSLPALRAVRRRFPEARIGVLALPWVADLYARESWVDEMIAYTAPRGAKDLPAKWSAARALGRKGFDTALILPNSFDSALTPWLARIPERIGYRRDARGMLLTRAIPRPAKSEIPRHESFYYLELVRRAGWLGQLPSGEPLIRLEGLAEAAREGAARYEELGLPAPVIGLSPGAAYGGAKRWLPERFAETARRLQSELGGSVAVFGTKDEREICEEVSAGIAAAGVRVRNLAGHTTLREFIAMAAATRVFVTNDSGSMHIASAAGVPTVAVFGATDHIGTGPTGPLARVVREQVECSPCLLRECPIDHRCMKAVEASRVARVALDLLK